ncbi:MAG: DUF4276 family protein [Acidobacteriia bacterium]|nr:DUF4276 family protein [Terriglobia bacterium]
MPSYGLIVEGLYDPPVYERLILRLDSPDARFFSLECGGVSNLMKNFPGLLKALETIDSGAPVDKALVIRDSGNRPRTEIEKEMRSRIEGRRYRFPQGVELCAVRQETETWLLADERAISSVAEGRTVGVVNGDLEDILDAKGRLRAILSRSKLDYLPQVLGSIADCSDLAMMRYRLPSFRSFEAKV